MEEFEAWEGYADFHDRQDWPGLVAYCEVEVAEDPDDLYAAERLADAYQVSADRDYAWATRWQLGDGGTRGQDFAAGTEDGGLGDFRRYALADRRWRFPDVSR